MKKNILYYLNAEINFEGFALVRDEAVLSVLPGGLVILPEVPEELRPYHHVIHLDENRVCRDLEILKIFRNRKIEKRTTWIEADNQYFESNPHSGEVE